MCPYARRSAAHWRGGSDQQVAIILSPGLNMKRNPLCGRNFEYFSEAPYFAVNNQELRRIATDSIVDERTLREICLTGFEIAVKEGKPGYIMTSYNKVNGTYSNENEHLLMDILRGDWGYDKAVVIDWGGSNDHAMGVKCSSTLEMPAPGLDSVRELLNAAKSGNARLDELITLALDTQPTI